MLAMDLTLDEACAPEGAQVAVEHLDYAAYRWNRIRAPEIAASRWIAIFPEAAEYEVKFQQEQSC